MTILLLLQFRKTTNFKENEYSTSKEIENKNVEIVK